MCEDSSTQVRETGGRLIGNILGEMLALAD
jgi:hypothetical protein